MTMIGTMFDADLRSRVAALCADLVHALPPGGFAKSGDTHGDWWPGDLGRPTTSGAQNGLRYAYFPETERLAIEADGAVALYATEGHAITGVSQQQGGSSGLRFSGPNGGIDLAALRRLDGERDRPAPHADASAPRPEASPPPAADDILATLERLAELQRKGVLTEAEFAAKKAELLARL
jgi:hypothetical protein